MLRILLIDDRRVSREDAVCILKREGFDVIEARDGLAGLQRAVEDAPDVVLVTPELTGLDGEEIRRRLAGDPATRHLPVLVSPARAVPAGLLAASGALRAAAGGAAPRQPSGLAAPSGRPRRAQAPRTRATCSALPTTSRPPAIVQGVSASSKTSTPQTAAKTTCR